MEADNSGDKEVEKSAGAPSSSEDPLLDREKFPARKVGSDEGAASPSEASGDASASGAVVAEEISMENLDKLLGDNDPSFTAEMEALAQGVQNADVQISDGADVLAQVHSNFEDTATDKAGLGKVGQSAAYPSANAKLRLKKGLITLLGRSKQTGVDVLYESLGQAQELRAQSKNVLKQYKGRDWKIIFMFCLTIVVMGFALKVLQPILDHWLKGDFFGNYDRVADQVVELDSKTKFQSFHDPLEEFNFIVQYERMIVNLKPSLNSTSNPMATFVIYAEGTSRETAVELKDRQMEIRDICQRVAEGLTYDEFVSAEGKRRFKNLVRKDVNEILNAGHLRAIYFNTVIVKP